MEESILILASASPRRADLLRKTGVPFEVKVSSAHEVSDTDLPVHVLCEQNAQAKARAVAALYPQRLVLGADTLVSLEGKTFGKPVDKADSFRMLSELQDHIHQVITGVALCCQERLVEDIFHVVTEVEFRSLSPQLIQDYMSKVNTLDKAGAYGIQDHGDMIIKGIHGSLSNVIGLPVEAVIEHLRRWLPGIRLKS